MIFFPFLAWWIEALVLAVATVIIATTVYWGRGGYASWLVSILALVSFLSKGALYTIVMNPSLFMGLVVVIYVVLGIIWSFVHWHYHVRRLIDRHNRGEYSLATFEHMSDYSDNAAMVVTWIFYWPFDILPTLCLEPARRFGRWIVNSLSGVYAAIAKRALEKYLPKTPVKK